MTKALTIIITKIMWIFTVFEYDFLIKIWNFDFKRFLASAPDLNISALIFHIFIVMLIFQSLALDVQHLMLLRGKNEVSRPSLE